jgi:predicted nucleotidyltransferase
LLKEQFGAQRVAAFGSLTHAGRFTSHSDVDIAAWGLTSANWLAAGAAARNLSDEIDINVVDVATCSRELLVAIERDGVPL